MTSLAVAAVWPVAARSQARKVYRIGFIGLGTAATWGARVEALSAGLRELGYEPGVDFIFELRWGETPDHLRELTTELLRTNVDVLFASTSTEVEIVRQATSIVPVVFATHADPVGVGHVASLPRPGGNITGLTVVQADLTYKALEIFKEFVPQVQKLGVLWSPAAPSYRPTLTAVEEAAAKLKLDTRLLPVRSPLDLGQAFETMELERIQGFFVSASAFTLSQREKLAQLGLQHRLPGMFGARDNVVAGGLMCYAPDAITLTRRAALYIDKILKGLSPSLLPVEQASKYLLVVNLKTAKALGLNLSPTLLARADEVIE